MNLYPRLDLLQLRPTRPPQLKLYVAEYEEGLGPTSPRVEVKLRRAKEYYSEVFAEFRLTVLTPVIDDRVPLTPDEVMTIIPSAMETGGGGGRGSLVCE